MDFFELISERHSVRSYDGRIVEKDKIQAILNSANQAPSAGNLQGYEIFVLSQKKQLDKLVNASYGQEFLGHVPVVLVFCANPSRSAERYGERGKNLYSIQDATIACTFSMMAATALGLSTVWVGAFDETEVKKIAGIPKSLQPVVLLPVGYSNDTYQIRTRRSLEDLVHYAGE